MDYRELMERNKRRRESRIAWSCGFIIALIICGAFFGLFYLLDPVISNISNRGLQQIVVEFAAYGAVALFVGSWVFSASLIRAKWFGQGD